MRDGWTGMELGELFDLVAQRHDPDDLEAELPYLGLENLETGLPTPAGFGRAGDVSSSVTPFEPDDVLFGRLRPYLRKVVHVDRPGVCTPEILVLRARDQVVIPRYLHLLVSSETVIDRCVQMSAGSRMPRTSAADLAGIEVDLPPLVVQRRVVDLVDAVDTYAAATRTLALSSESLIAALESAAMASDEHHCALGDVTQFAGGYAFPPDRQGNTEGDIPFYKVSDMNAPENRHTMTLASNYVSDDVLSEMRAKAWPAGTVVFPKVGAALLTEKRRVLGTRAAFDNNVMGLVPLPAIRSDYLLSYMRTVRLGDFAQQGAVPSVNQSHLRDLVIPVPPLEDQDEFVSTVAAMRSALEAVLAEGDALSGLRSALIGELLSGEREIPESYDDLVGLVA